MSFIFMTHVSTFSYLVKSPESIPTNESNGIQSLVLDVIEHNIKHLRDIKYQNSNSMKFASRTLESNPILKTLETLKLAIIHCDSGEDLEFLIAEP